MRRLLPLLPALLIAAPVHADEGMWLLNAFPRERVQKKYAFSPDDKWLEHVRLSSVRLAQGCSGSFVSASGLVMTNHHCAHSCIQQLSTPQRDFIKTGFTAATLGDEVKCPEIEVNQLTEISDVTARVRKATQGLAGQAYNQAEKGELSRIEKECATSDRLRCDVVTLYQGGLYHLYKYRRYQDVRLVFAPELAIAFFGGDPDNFMFPRYDLDLSFLRVYEDGKPARIDHHLAWSPAGVKEGDLTFVSGHPGRTDRLLTVAEMEYQRDVGLPERLLRYAEARGMLLEFQRRGPEQRRVATHDLFSIENAFKAYKGRLEALLDPSLLAAKREAERKLREAVARDPGKQRSYGAAWDDIARAMGEMRKLRKPYNLLERGTAFPGDLFHLARTLVRAADERQKPNDQRYREYRDSALPELSQAVLSSAPISDELETLWLTFGLTKLREELGADHPSVRAVLGKESPEEMAERLVKGTKLKDLAVRKRLWEGSAKDLAAAGDPLLELARKVDPEARQARKRYEDEVESVVKRASEQIARARFEIEGTSSYPDATFTLRLSYGQVRGYEENGRQVRPLTDLAGAFERATGRPPFDLPESWTKARGRLTLSTPMNFASDNDIVGGNSGSPVFDRAARVVGLVFDGNIQSLGGHYHFDPAVNRMVAVHSEAILHALSRVYGCDRLVEELRPRKVR